jgi:type II secretory pathway pseudopilin PulG
MFNHSPEPNRSNVMLIQENSNLNKSSDFRQSQFRSRQYICGIKSHQLKSNRCQGFTLIEMTMVLMILFLLIGASIIGLQIINKVKEKQLETDFSAIPMMIYEYQDKYKAIPGDDINAVSRFSNLLASVRNGDGEGLILGKWFDTNPESDNAIIWQHLRLAGFLNGSAELSSASYIQQNALGKPVDIQSGTNDANLSPIKDSLGHAIKGSLILCSRGIPGDMALLLDAKLDDGTPGKGRMLATPDVTNFVHGANSATIGTGFSSDVSPERFYIVCMGVN